MKFFKTRTAAILISAVLAVLAVIIGIRSAIPAQSSSNPFVYDGAGVLSAQTESEIYAQNAASSKGSFYVITASHTGRHDLYDYAIKITEDWNLNSYSSILLVMQPDKDDYQLIYGSDYSYALDGDGFGAFLGQYIEPYFAKGDYSGAALGFAAGAKAVAAGKDSYVFPDYSDNYYSGEDYGSAGGEFLLVLIVFVLICVVVVAVIASAAGSSGGFSARRTHVFFGPTVRHYHPPRRYAPPPSSRPGSFSSPRPGGFSGGGRSMGGFSGGGRSSGGFSGGGRSGSFRGGGRR